MKNPTTHELLVARFGTVRKSLDEVMSRLTDDLLEWSPATGMRTVGGQLFEIVGKEVELLEFAKAKGRDEWNEIDSFGEGEKTVAGWRAIVDTVRGDTLAYLGSLSDADLGELVAFPVEGWWEGLYLTAVPMHEIFRNIATHEWYHTGQLVTYLWRRGDDPYQG